MTKKDKIPKKIRKTILGLYVDEAAETPLLTREEEVELAKTIEAGKNAKRKLDEAGLTLLAEEKAELLKRVKAGKWAKQHFAKANLRLVISIAKEVAEKYINKSSNSTILSLIREGNYILLRAVNGFNWRKGNRFSTYAARPIRKAMKTALYDDGYMGDKNFESIDAEVDSKDSRFKKRRSGHDFFEDKKAVPLSLEYDKNLLRQVVERVLSELEHTDIEIVKLLFGFGNQHPCDVSDIAKIFKTTPDKMRQRIQYILRRLRGHEKLHEKWKHLVSP